MKNITISVSEKVEKFAKVLAAKQGKSLSRFVSELLSELMVRERNSSAWIEDFTQEKPYLSVEEPKLKRDDLYDRKILR